MTTYSDLRLTSAAFRADPYPVYRRLRAEAPVVPVKLGFGQRAWLITRYDDVLAALKDERLLKSRANAMGLEGGGRGPWMPGFLKPLARNMLDLDDPDHARLRGLVHKAFTPRVVEQLRTKIEGLTHSLLDAALARGRIELIHDLALPLPTTIIAMMLGVPLADREKFQRWSQAIVAVNPNDLSMVGAIPALVALMGYLRRLIAARRADPRDDLLSALIQAEEAGDSLSEDELLAMMVLLLIAGHETTVNLIGNGTLALLEHPAQLALLRERPELLRSAVEELLRYNSPVAMATERYPREDLAVAGVTIPRGELVHAVLAAANRDESQFAEPDTLDITRTPNRHLAFGQGLHYCIGAPLARMEGQIALGAIIERVPDLRLAVNPTALRWRRGYVLRGLEALPLACAARRAAA